LSDAASHEDREVAIPVAGGESIAATLTVPAGARGVVAFAHGSGSGRLSPRNQAVARTLREGRFATLLVDLLTTNEEAVDVRTRALRFDIDLLASRLVVATDWLRGQPGVADLPIGYFGASTGAAAALVAAAERPNIVKAIVSRGGRPDLAGPALDRVRAATLFIVGGADPAILPLNQGAFNALTSETDWHEVPRATHLFEEPGALEEVAAVSLRWFERHLADRLTTRDRA
jgi:putative phosphoribosyl transferase